MIVPTLASAARAARRALPSFGLAVALLATTLGAPTSTFAQDPVIRDHRMGEGPVARVQVVMQKVHIYDDRDGRFAGEGEFDFWYTLVCAKVTDNCMGYDEIFLDGYGKKFGAGSGEDYTLNQVLPVDGTVTSHYNATAATGYPLYPGHNYRLRWGMEEYDAVSNPEQMGDFRHHMTPENNWGIGSYTLRSVHNDGSDGDFSVTFEVRPVPLPDLRPVAVKVTDLPGSTRKRVCTAVQNIGPVNAGPFSVSLRVNDNTPNDWSASAAGLASSQATEVCGDTELPAGGPHKLQVAADPGQAIVEYNEVNNRFEQSYTGTGSAPMPMPSPGPTSGPITITGKENDKEDGGIQGASQADLTVGAIKVNGQVLDGKNDCRDGKNSVSVVVKNTGATKAGSFAVQLEANGEQVGEVPINGLDASKEREIKFDDVRLKKGEQKLTVTLDGKNTVAESQEENNELTVTARCAG